MATSFPYFRPQNEECGETFSPPPSFCWSFLLSFFSFFLSFLLLCLSLPVKSRLSSMICRTKVPDLRVAFPDFQFFPQTLKGCRRTQSATFQSLFFGKEVESEQIKRNNIKLISYWNPVTYIDRVWLKNQLENIPSNNTFHISVYHGV